jgi:CspA family cold shock protein
MTEQGFGFIQDDKGTQYFFHRSAVRGNVWASLTLRQPVSFVVRSNPKGPRAEDVAMDE